MPLFLKVLIIIFIIGTVWYKVNRKSLANSQTQQPQTAKVEKGTLTVVVNASGTVSSQTSATVDTQASGVVKSVYVENGQKVASGDKIAELDLDLIGKQRSSQAYSSYLAAKNNLETQKINYYSLQNDLLNNWKDFMDIAQTPLFENSDKTPNTATRQLPEFMTTNNSWLSAEAKYKQQQNFVTQAQTALNSAWLTHQQSSSTIYAPISGTVTGLSLQVGSVLTAQSNTSGTATSQKIASIKTDASPVIQVDLTQIDTPKVKIGNKVTITFDALPNKTYTGKIISIDTIGSVNQGVTTYPAFIKLVTDVPQIYSNMTANANIITEIKDNVLLVPSSSIQNQNGNYTVRIMKNGKEVEINIEIGSQSSTQTEIISGLSAGDVVITSRQTSTSSRQSSNQTRSPFSGFGGGGGGGAFFRR